MKKMLLIPLLCLVPLSIAGKSTYPWPKIEPWQTKGFNVYCWKINGFWCSGILPCKNFITFTSEVEDLQKRSEYSLMTMRQIIKQLPEGAVMVVITETPPKTVSCFITDENFDDYVYVCGQLGVEFPWSMYHGTNYLP